jgi:hypothetical protein
MGLWWKKNKELDALKAEINNVNGLYENIRKSLHNLTLCTYGIINTEESYIVYKSDKNIYRPIFIKGFDKKDDPEYAEIQANELLDMLKS